MKNTNEQLIVLGSIVRLVTSFPKVEAGTLAYVYEEYSLGAGRWNGKSIICETGVDLGGFSEGEQVDHLEPVCFSGFRYRYTNVGDLGQDFENGIFNTAFAMARELQKEPA